MTVRCWRLLAIFWLIVGSIFPLSGQSSTEDRLRPGVSVKAEVIPRFDLDLDIAGPPDVAPRFRIFPVPPQPAPVVPIPTPLQQNLFRQLIHSAGSIFVGRVIAVGPGLPPISERSATAITFQIEHAMLGTSAGTTLTIHEWRGLWDRGERYRVGERVLLFLYPQSKLGFTSPIAGTLGRFAVNSQDQIELTGPHAALWTGTGTFSGKAVVSYPDFALAIQRFRGEPR